MNTISGISEKNRITLDALNRLSKGPISINEASRILNLSLRETRIYLGYLSRRGWLSRIKRGLYKAVPLGTINPQEYREHPWVVANTVFYPCYIGGCSAAEHWDLTDQIFKSVFVFTSRIFRNKKIIIQGTEFKLKLTKQVNIKRAKKVWIENSKIQISDPSQTVVDILDDPSSGGGIRHVAEIVDNYFRSEYRNDKELMKYIKVKKNRTIYKRLGYMLEVLSFNALGISTICKKNISKGYSALDPSIKSKGFYNRRWNLRINAELEK